MQRMRKVMASFAFLLSGLFALWFVAGWVDSIWREGLSETVYGMMRWPAVVLTIGLPALVIFFLALGASLLSESRHD
jgi:hypothetical protein